MPNLNRSLDERSPYRALSMIWLAKHLNSAALCIARNLGINRTTVSVGALLAVLIIAAVELHPVTPAPVDRGRLGCGGYLQGGEHERR